MGGGYQYHWMLPLPIRTGAVQRPFQLPFILGGRLLNRSGALDSISPADRISGQIDVFRGGPTIILPSYYEVLLWGSYPTLVPSYYYYLPTIPLFRPRPTIIPCRCRINPLCYRGPRDDILRGLLEHRVNGNRWACYVYSMRGPLPLRIRMV